MPEHLRALLVILVLASAVFFLAKGPACAEAMAEADFKRRRNVWFAVTLCAFLAHDFWLFVGLAALVLVASLRAEPNRLALYFFLAFALPSLSAPISGLGIIRQFFDLSYLRLLSLTLLLPTAAVLFFRPAAEKAPTFWADRLIAAYVLLNLGLQLQVDTFTNTLRYGFYAFMDVALPYYVASRALRERAQFRDVLMSLTVAAMVLAAVGVFEYGKKWLLYSALETALDRDWNYGAYLSRGGSLRALGSTGQPIALGYVMAVAAACMLYLRRGVARPTLWWLGLGLLLAGLLAALSRGPWLGAAVGLLVFVATGRQPLMGLIRLSGLAGIAVPLLLASPLGPGIIERLPFVGTVEAETITYRQRLLEMSLGIIKQNPFFGSFDFLQYLEELRQGQGIIDIVNTYLGITLSSGLVGLGLFLSVFVSVGWKLWRGLRTLPAEEAELHLLGRALLAALAAILIIIFTVSSITVIPLIYWSMAGIGLACTRLFETRAVPAATVATHAAAPPWPAFGTRP